MKRERRSFSPEDRLAIVQEGQREGTTATCRKYLAKGVEGLKPAYPRVDPQVRALEEENERLKRIIARQALEIEVKSELLKKTPIQAKLRK